MSVRALLGRPAESLLLALGVALAVGATAAGVTLAGTTRAQSEALLASPRYREIVVSTRAETSTMVLPARMRGADGQVVGVDDLERARSVTQAVQYAYLSNPTGFLLGEIPLPSGLSKSAAGPVGESASSAGPAGMAGSVQVFVLPGDATESGSGSRPGSPGAAEAAGTAFAEAKGAKELPAVSGDDVKEIVSAKGLADIAQSLVQILSIMLVEVLGRTRQIAIARAFGATKGAMLREFLARSLILVGGACAIGVALSVVLSGPLTDLVMPIFRGVTEADLGGAVVSPEGVLVGVAATLGVGGLMGVLPVFPALATPIAEGVRD